MGADGTDRSRAAPDGGHEGDHDHGDHGHEHDQGDHDHGDPGNEHDHGAQDHDHDRGEHGHDHDDHHAVDVEDLSFAVLSITSSRHATEDDEEAVDGYRDDSADREPDPCVPWHRECPDQGLLGVLVPRWPGRIGHGLRSGRHGQIAIVPGSVRWVLYTGGSRRGVRLRERSSILSPRARTGEPCSEAAAG
jgi:hypothetical protein